MVEEKMGQQFVGKEEYIQDVFSMIAPYYDRMNIIMSLGLLSVWRSFMLKQTGLVKGQWVLDVCTGTGEMAYYLHKIVGDVGKVVGLDICEDMLTEAMKKKKDGETVEFVCGNALEIPFVEDTFACVTSAFALRNVTDVSRAISEMVRVCKRDGRVVIMDITKPKDSLLKMGFGLYFNVFIPLLGYIVDRGTKVRGFMAPYTWLSKSLIDFPQDEEMTEICRSVGLKEVEYYSLTGGVVTVYVGVKQK